MSKNHGIYAGEPMVNFQNREKRLERKGLSSFDISKLLTRLQQLKKGKSLTEFRQSPEFHDLLKLDYGYTGEKKLNPIAYQTNKLTSLVRDESKLTEYWWKLLESSIDKYEKCKDAQAFKDSCLRRVLGKCWSQRSVQRLRNELPFSSLGIDDMDAYFSNSRNQSVNIMDEDVSESINYIHKILNKPKQQYLLRLFIKFYLDKKADIEEERLKTARIVLKNVYGTKGVSIGKKKKLSSTSARLKQYSFPKEIKLPKLKTKYKSKTSLSEMAIVFGEEFGGTQETNTRYIKRFRKRIEELIRIKPNTTYGNSKVSFYNQETAKRNKQRKEKYEALKNQPVKTYNIND